MLKKYWDQMKDINKKFLGFLNILLKKYEFKINMTQKFVI